MYKLNEIILNDLYLFKYKNDSTFFIAYITNKRLNKVYNKLKINFIDKILYKLNLKEEPIIDISAILDLKMYNNDEISSINYWTKMGVTICEFRGCIPVDYKFGVFTDDIYHEKIIGNIINLTKLVEENIIDKNIIDSLSSEDNTIKQMTLEYILNKIK